MSLLIRTTDEALAEFVAQVKDDSSSADSTFPYARNAFVAIHAVYSLACSGDAHPAIIRRCAQLLETLASDLAHEAANLAEAGANDGLRSLCEHIHLLVEGTVADAEHGEWMALSRDEVLDQLCEVA